MHRTALAFLAAMAATVPAAAQYRYDDGRGYRPDPYREDQYRQDRYGQDRYGEDRYGQDRYRQDSRGGDVPGGSYLRSCGDVRRDGSTLVAVCKGPGRSHFETSIDIARCGRSEIGNTNGALQCGNTRGSARRID